MKIKQGDEIRIIAETSIKGVPAHPGDENRIVGKDLDAADARILVDYNLAEHIPQEPPAPSEPEGDARKEVILATVRTVLDEGEHLTQSGDPKVEAIEELLGFNISAAERDEAMETIEEEKESSIPEGEEREVKILEAVREVLAEGNTTQDGLPEVEAIENLIGFDISADERDEVMGIIREEEARKKDILEALRTLNEEESEVNVEAVRELSGHDITEEELKIFVEMLSEDIKTKEDDKP